MRGIFGLDMAPRQWWPTLKETLIGLHLKHRDGNACTMKQSLVDQTLFVGHGRHGRLFGIIWVHIDDLLVAFGDKDMQKVVNNICPFGSWEEPPSVF